MTQQTIDRTLSQRMAFALIYVDQIDPARAARELECGEDEVMRLADVELERKLRDAEQDGRRAFWNRRGEERLKRKVIGKQEATCLEHGPYTQVWTQIDPPVEPHAAHARMNVEDFCLGPKASSCPECDRALQVIADARDAEIRGGMSAKDQQNLQRIKQANIPRRYHQSTIQNWLHPTDQQERVWRWACDYVNACETVTSMGRSAVLVGGTGTGKTHLAIGVLKAFMNQGATGYYTTAIDMLGRIKATYNAEAAETETHVIDRLTSVDLLVIDEIGRQLDTNYEVAQIFRVLDRRSSECRPTLLVSNLGVQAFKDFMGEHIIDRLAQYGGKMLQLDWPSHRRRGRA